MTCTIVNHTASNEIDTNTHETIEEPAGAFYVWARLPISDSEDFVRWMLESFQLDGETTMVAPGSGFYTREGQGQNEIRIACVLEPPRLQRAMQILAEGLETYRKARAQAPSASAQTG